MLKIKKKNIENKEEKKEVKKSIWRFSSLNKEEDNDKNEERNKIREKDDMLKNINNKNKFLKEDEIKIIDQKKVSEFNENYNLRLKYKEKKKEEELIAANKEKEVNPTKEKELKADFLIAKNDFTFNTKVTKEQINKDSSKIELYNKSHKRNFEKEIKQNSKSLEKISFDKFKDNNIYNNLENIKINNINDLEDNKVEKIAKKEEKKRTWKFSVKNNNEEIEEKYNNNINKIKEKTNDNNIVENVKEKIIEEKSPNFNYN